MKDDSINFNDFKARIAQSSDKLHFYQEYSQRYPNMYGQRALIAWAVCEDFVAKNDFINAFKYIKQYIYFTFYSNNPSIEDCTYFSFRGFSDYAIQGIKESSLSLIHPRNFNDPFDPILVAWLDNIIREKEITAHISEKDKVEFETYCLLRRACELLRIRCMVKASNEEINNTIEHVNPLMWAHYAVCHTGFCAEYKISSNYLKQYNTATRFVKLLPVSYDGDMVMDSSHIEIYKALTYKDSIWQYENECRLLYYDLEEQNETVTKLENIDPEAIYLGYKCSTENELLIRKAIHNKNIKLFRMIIDPQDCSKLKKKRIL